MSKKLLKYGKFLLSMALIFCLIVPSYASLSASDGSAFVTKSEFDSALADFNSRLTTFEAGINSKIDSQVTSYLDRNGIWSGVKQILNSNSAELTHAFQAPAQTHAGGSGVVWGATYDIITKTYVPKTNKAGMLCGTWLWHNKNRQNTNQTRFGYSCTKAACGNGTSDDGFQTILNLTEWKGTTKINDSYSRMFLYAVGEVPVDVAGSTQGAVVATLSTEDVVYPFKFFVSKDTEIKWNITMNCHFGFVAAVNGVSVLNSGADAATCVVEMKDCEIY